MTFVYLTGVHARVIVNMEHVAYCTPRYDKSGSVIVFSDANHTELSVSESLSEITTQLEKQNAPTPH